MCVSGPTKCNQFTVQSNIYDYVLVHFQKIHGENGITSLYRFTLLFYGYLKMHYSSPQ